MIPPLDTTPRAAEFQRRHEALVHALHQLGLDHALITTTENIYYLTGATFEPLERPFFLIVDADGGRHMLLPVLERDHLRKAWGLRPEHIHCYREFPAPAGQGWAERLLDGQMLRGRFAFEEGTPWQIAAPLSRAGGQALDLLGPIRLIKSGWEIEQVQRAARYADWGLAQVLRSAWQGGCAAQTFMPMQRLQRKIMRELPDWDPLSTRVLAAAWPAPLSAEPHAVPPLGMRLGDGPHVALVLTRVNGYAAECERSFFTAPPRPRERERFALMSEARAIAFAMLRPGVACAEIDGAVNRFLDAAGHADFRTRLHRCGHGFGLGNHEPPWIAEGSDHVLAAGMLVSIEPGLYEAGVGGYRHSDTVLVTDRGHRRLTEAPSGLEALVLPRPRLGQRLGGWLVRRSLRL
ncbi:Xaa-Pro peptidase family protein [Pelomonas sp. CA6]|uniref:M24 family metallopeptidase n=1 Tax=Pelomonas sp. CA6 TaxID=2907999 RepID=UPI001F4A8905|nr:Xaa-Pro peptidase family protein [Pelomonas sp. CA6]MCH7341875.1 Xaa-Pro peptidase family protein [Pelomonas sp. CA6]